MSRKWTHLMIHHGAGKPGMTVEQIREEHQARGWQDIGYHFVLVRPNGGQRGHLKRGRPDTKAGAHAGVNPWNSIALGLCVPGYFHPGSSLSEHMSEELYQDLLGAVLHIMQLYHIPAANILGHREVRATACPGEYFPLARLKADVKKRIG
jgi:N-acetylmuramoyl-L-alanine amidase